LILEYNPFLQLWATNQTVNVGDNVFSVIPSNKTNYIGKLIPNTIIK